MNKLEILTTARAVLSDPKCWTQGCIARDHDGDQVGYDHEGAACWCLHGALWKAAGKFAWAKAAAVDDIHQLLVQFTPDGESPIYFNDKNSTTHQMVLDVLDRAIGSLREVASPLKGETR